MNAAIFNAGGPALEAATKNQATFLMPGNAVVVPLPSTSPLYSREGVTHIIHVLGQNMNPERPNCLDDDYIKGCKILRDAYLSLFEGFLSIAKTQSSRNILSEPSVPMTKSWAPWLQSLYKIAMQPEKYKDEVLEASDDVVVLNDKYPKVKYLLPSSSFSSLWIIFNKWRDGLFFFLFAGKTASFGVGKIRRS